VSVILKAGVSVLEEDGVAGAATVGQFVGARVAATGVRAVLCVGAGLIVTPVCASDVQSREAERSSNATAVKKMTTASNAFQEM